jgi:hypothetical protein
MDSLSDCISQSMDKLKLTGQNLGRVFKSRLGRVGSGHELYTFRKTAKLKVENSAQTIFRFSSVSFRAPRSKCWTRVRMWTYVAYGSSLSS